MKPVRPHSWPELIAWWCLNIAILAIPLATSNFTLFGRILPALSYPVVLDQVDLPKSAWLVFVVLIGVAAWGYGQLRYRLGVHTAPVLWVYAVFLTLALAATFTSVDVSTSVFGAVQRREGLITFLGYAGLAWLVLQMVDHPLRVRSLGRTVVIASSVMAVYGLCQVAGFDPQAWGRLAFESRRAFATLGNPDLLGGYLLFGLALAPSIALSEPDDRLRALWWVCSAVIGAAWLASFVRGAWIGGVVALVLIAVAARRGGVRANRIDVVAIGVITGLLGMIVVISLAGDALVFSVVERVRSLANLESGSLLGRRHIWAAARDAIQARPLLGWGPDAFRYAWYQYRPVGDLRAFGYSGVADAAHSYPLQLAATLGIPAAIAFTVAVVWSLKRAVGCAFERGHGATRLVLTGWFAGVVAHLVHLTFGVSGVAGTAMLWAGLGMMLAPKAHEVSPREWVRGLAVAVPVVTLAAASVLLVAQLSADRAAIHVIVTPDFTQKQEWAQMAVRRAPWDHTYRLQLADVLTQRIQMDALQLENLRQSGQDGSAVVASIARSQREAQEQYELVLESVPREYRAADELSRLCLSLGDCLGAEHYERAAEVARRYEPLAPTGFTLRMTHAIALLDLGRYEQARRVVGPMREWDPRVPGPAVVHAQAAWELGERGVALEELGRLERDYPSDQQVLNLRDLIARSTDSSVPEESR